MLYLCKKSYLYIFLGVLLLNSTSFSHDIIKPTIYISNDISKDVINHRAKGSHINIFMPSIPYSYISKLINGTLFRLCDNVKGWDYMMATSYKKQNPLTYDITLRRGVKFQDGSFFDADIAVKNFRAFIKHPFTYTDIHNRLKSVEKLGKYKIRFHLSQPYEMFITDLARINLYSNAYLKKYSWLGQSTGDNMKSAGLYGLGPYILTSGYATGLKQTPKVELKANPYYYEKGLPYIENITIYTQLGIKEAYEMAVLHENKLDITPIPFNKKTEVVHSKYAKLVTIPSTNNISIYFNLLKPNGILKNKNIRIALNKAINQDKLLQFVYKHEGKTAPTTASVNYGVVKNATKDMSYYGKNLSDAEKKRIKKILNGIKLHVETQDRFMFLWKGIEYQLRQYGVKLIFNITSTEKDIYNELLTNKQSPKEWDILTWGNDDWYGKHPWTVFFSYRVSSNWSAIDKDDMLEDYVNNLFVQKYGSADFNQSVQNIIRRVYDEAYMLFVPSINNVYAVNKEVDFKPTSIALMPLWRTKITKYHWSIRKGEYPKNRLFPMFPERLK